MDLEQKLEIIQIARVACGTLAIVFLLLTLFLFWKFGIVRALLERTGLAKKKAITSQKEINAKSGRLKKTNAERIAEQEFTGALSGERKRRGKSGDLQTGANSNSGSRQSPDQSTAVLQQTPADDGTMLLGKTPADESTTLLEQPPADEGTMLLEQNQRTAPVYGAPGQSAGGRFQVIEDIRIVHTNEQI